MTSSGYVPAVGRTDRLEAECGSEHAIWDWSENVRLRGRWPDRAQCKRGGYSQADGVAHFHWCGLGQSREGVWIAVATWKQQTAIFEPWRRIPVPVVVVAVTVRERLSQYLGWIPADRFNRIQPSDVLPWDPDRRVMKRVVTQARLLSGFPRELAEEPVVAVPEVKQGRLF